MSTTFTGPIKLAIRDEGEWVVAYFATLDEAEKIEVGRMAKGVLQKVPGVWESWKILLISACNQFVQDELGVKPVGWQELEPPGRN